MNPYMPRCYDFKTFTNHAFKRVYLDYDYFTSKDSNFLYAINFECSIAVSFHFLKEFRETPFPILAFL